MWNAHPFLLQYGLIWPGVPILQISSQLRRKPWNWGPIQRFFGREFQVFVIKRTAKASNEKPLSQMPLRQNLKFVLRRREMCSNSEMKLLDIKQKLGLCQVKRESSIVLDWIDERMRCIVGWFPKSCFEIEQTIQWCIPTLTMLWIYWLDSNWTGLPLRFSLSFDWAISDSEWTEW